MNPTSILFGYAVLGACLVLPSIASSFVMADVMGMTPSEMTAVAVWCSLPWVTKPLWGAVSDRCSVCGYRRRPYVCVFSLSGPNSRYGSWLSRLQEYFSIDAIK